MKKQPYRLTNKGIRIPRHKVKHMSLPADCPEDMHLPLPCEDLPLSNLCFINNLHLHAESAPALENTQVIEAEYWKEDSRNDA